VLPCLAVVIPMKARLFQLLPNLSGRNFAKLNPSAKAQNGQGLMFFIIFGFIFKENKMGL